MRCVLVHAKGNDIALQTEGYHSRKLFEYSFYSYQLISIMY